MSLFAKGFDQTVPSVCVGGSLEVCLSRIEDDTIILRWDEKGMKRFLDVSETLVCHSVHSCVRLEWMYQCSC